jgi:hypothetical protein
MPHPIELCLEDMVAVRSPDAERYLRCVALVGPQLGLGVDPQGNVTWRSADALAAELWVSADDRLILLRPAGAPAVRLSRASRELDVPEGKPVVVLPGDLVAVGPRRLRVHIHGVAASVCAPAPLSERALAQVARAAAVLAVGAAVAGCEQPVQRPLNVGVPPATTATGTWTRPLRPGEPPPPPSGSAPIEVREMPPAPPLPPPPPQPQPPPPGGG